MPASTAARSAASGAKYTSIARKANCKAILPRGGIDEETLEVRAVEVTGNHIGPSRQIASQFACRAMDGADDIRKCHEAIAARNAAAVIPPRKNAKPWKPTSPGALAIVLEPMADKGSPSNEALRASKDLGRAIWRRWSGYHRRSRVEAKMNCIKLLGQSLMAVRHCA